MVAPPAVRLYADDALRRLKFILTQAFTTAMLKVEDIFTWPKIDSLADAPPNALYLRGIVGVEESQDTTDAT